MPVIFVDVEIAVAYLVAYAWRKARRVAGRADDLVDQGLDAGMDRLHGMVAARLGPDPAWKQLEAQAGSDLDTVAVAQRTMERVRLALEDEAERDPGFGTGLDELVARLQVLEEKSGTRVVSVTASGDRAVAIGGDNSGIIAAGDGAVNVQRR
jgi:hypothetical protein